MFCFKENNSRAFVEYVHLLNKRMRN